MYTTEQERFWAGNFGDEYITRNYNILENNVAFFLKYYLIPEKLKA